MEEMKPLGSPTTEIQDYFARAMVEQLRRPMPDWFKPSNIRDEAYYAKREPEPINPDTHCIHCGHAFEDPWY